MLKKSGIGIIVLSSFVIMAFRTSLKNEEKESIKSSSEAAVYEPIVVLELFTSQGCSSCPPADVLLEKMKNEFPDEVFALSYHVDYWNYIGWEDPFSNADFSKKQREYNLKFNNRSNYTPQVVMNGKEHFVGSNKAKLIGGIAKYKKEKTANDLTVTNVRSTADSVIFNYSVAGAHQGRTLRALLVLDERITVVKRGENRNRTLKNSNIVVEEKISSVDSLQGSISIAIPEIVNPSEKISLIVLVEDAEYTITAASKKRIKRF